MLVQTIVIVRTPSNTTATEGKSICRRQTKIDESETAKISEQRFRQTLWEESLKKKEVEGPLRCAYNMGSCQRNGTVIIGSSSIWIIHERAVHPV